MIWTTQTLEFFDKKPFKAVLTILEVSASETIKWCQSIYHKTSIFHYNYCSVTHETWLKVAVNMEDLTCILETVCSLNHLN